MNPLFILEALLLCSREPIPQDILLKALETPERSVNTRNTKKEEEDGGGIHSDTEPSALQEWDAKALAVLLAELAQFWANRGLELVEVAGGWRFQSRPEVQPNLERLYPEKPPKYSRSVMETLAIIAWKQPVTRGDIEDIRGVSVASNIVRQLEDRGWIEVVGHRDTIGHPALLCTTRQFLEDFSLTSLSDLPPLSSFTQLDALASLDAPAMGPAAETTASQQELLTRTSATSATSATVFLTTNGSEDPSNQPNQQQPEHILQ